MNKSEIDAKRMLENISKCDGSDLFVLNAKEAEALSKWAKKILDDAAKERSINKALERMIEKYEYEVDEVTQKAYELCLAAKKIVNECEALETFNSETVLKQALTNGFIAKHGDNFYPVNHAIVWYDKDKGIMIGAGTGYALNDYGYTWALFEKDFKKVIKK